MSTYFFDCTWIVVAIVIELDNRISSNIDRERILIPDASTPHKNNTPDNIKVYEVLFRINLHGYARFESSIFTPDFSYP